MTSISISLHTDNIIIGHQRYRCGELLCSCLDLQCDHPAKIEKICQSSREWLLFPETVSESVQAEYARRVGHASSIFAYLDRLAAKLPVYQQYTAQYQRRNRLRELLASSGLFDGDMPRASAAADNSDAITLYNENVVQLVTEYHQFISSIIFINEKIAPLLDRIASGESEIDFEIFGVKFEYLPASLSLSRSGNTSLSAAARFDSLRDLCCFDLIRTIETGGLLPRRCEVCKEFFLPATVRARFCERVAPDESVRTCRDVGAQLKFSRKCRDSQAHTIYSRLYKSTYARVSSKKMTSEQFSVWSRKAAVLRDQAAAGEITCEELEEKLRALRDAI